ncbi:hypothetical protein ASZ78_001897 [Callipepla squamata]|uniref:Aminopeptidase n=1 Tax=Callipepla squamata TaxID=9009 RepID=A0A226MM61_CALSU|nr:hypothetical protein ASZ78_001897 [Callipepla squamata]
MALEEKREKRPPVTPMMIEEEAALRNGSRGLPPGPWAEAAGPRPRTTERHIAVHKRLVLGFAVSILALLAVTMVAVLLSVRFEECGAAAAADGPPRAANNGSLPGPAAGQPRGRAEPREEARGGEEAAERRQEEEEDEEEEWQRRRQQPPWARPRLPRHLRPLHYNLMLSAFMENFTFCGEVNVQLEVRNASRYIVLHAHRMHIEAVRVAEDKLAGAVRVARSFLYPQTQVLVVVLNRSLEVQRSYNLKIIYNALIENELLGFFRSSYVLHGERRFLGVTQFSPTHARKAFPCFDEPIYKATFKISIKHQATYISLSNMPVETSVFEEDGWVTDHFSQTPLMSTYYLAWAVCNFTYRETVTKSGVVIHLGLQGMIQIVGTAFVCESSLIPGEETMVQILLPLWSGELYSSTRVFPEVRLYARPDAIRRGSGDYALNITRRLIEFYEDYFKVPYSLPKLDLLAVPKHPYAAMENWGLSVFVEQRILLDPSISSISYLLDVTMVIVHELCHQWFGDLVTPVWWEDVWLKEGFAHYFEFIGTDYLYPGWNMEKQRFLTDVLHEVMLLDGLTSSHPVSQEVQQATDIDRVFDWIAYKKGAALIRMLANFMGHSVFQMGLQDYLTIHKYGNAARNDLWNTLSKALKRVGKSVNIQEVMDQWTLQMGYPVITILGNETTDSVIVISQERFVYDSDTKTKDFGPGDNSYLWQIPLTIAVGNTSHISSEAIIWVSNKSEHHRIPALEEASWLLGNINQTGYFRVNYDIRNWRLLINQLTRNHEVISVSDRAGLIDDAFNLARELRREVIMLACSFGNKHCHQQAATLISDWISSNRNRLLNLSLNSEVVLDQDAIDVIIHVARNPHGRDLAWKFFREKWKILNARYGEALFMNSKLISGVTEFLNTEEELRELKNFIKSYEEGAAASFSRAVETVEANVRWQRLYKEELFQWLRKSLTH